MNIFDSIWKMVLSLFGKKELDSTAHSKSKRHKEEYERMEHINFTSIFANSLSNKAVTDSTMAIKDAAGKDSRRSEWLGEGLKKLWDKNKDIVAQTLGKGGKIFVPYVQDGKPYVDIIDQSRMVITAMKDDEITGATLMADISSVDGKVYYRFADYELIGNTHTIRNSKDYLRNAFVNKSHGKLCFESFAASSAQIISLVSLADRKINGAQYNAVF